MHRLWFVAVLAAVALSVAACGGSKSTVHIVTATPAAATGTSTNPSSSALALEADYVRVFRTVGPSVVQISTSEGLGSGVVFDGKGHIVTNAHVVGTSKNFTVTTGNGNLLKGTLVGTFVPDDLAVIKVNSTALRPATFGRSANLRVGDIVMAIGNPLGFRSSVTNGIVSALGRTVSEPTGATLPSVIQTSAPINPGNSGGALVDLNAHVVGIPTLAAEDPQLGGAAVGIGFAIPSDLVTNIAGQIVANGHVVNSHRAYLGVMIGETVAQNGVYIGGVTAGGPAAKAGLKVGDRIVAVNGTPTPTTVALAAAIARLAPGTPAKVKVVEPDGKTKTATVTLGQYPGSGKP
jgi:putative serine protease PepD